MLDVVRVSLRLVKPWEVASLSMRLVRRRVLPGFRMRVVVG